MAAKSREILQLLFAALQAARVYSPEHPHFKDLATKAYDILTTVLEEKREFSFGVIGDDVACGEEILVDLAARMRLLCLSLKEKSLDKVVFLAGLRKDEFIRFLSFIALPQKRSEEDLANFMALEGIKSIKAGRLTKPVEAVSPEAGGQLPISYHHALAGAAEMMARLSRNEPCSPLELRYFSLSILENYAGEYYNLLSLWPSLKPEQRLIAHSINTSLIVMTVTTGMGFSREDVLDLGLAALFHDLGKMATFGLAGFSDERHMVTGARLLLAAKDSLSSLPAVVSFEHHLRFDLRGQPRLSGVAAPHEASLLVAMGNIYDNLIRKWKDDSRFDPAFVFRSMTAEKGRVFAPDWLDRFFQAWGIWPEGFLVKLSDGTLAKVIRLNEGLPGRPRVQVLKPEGQEDIIDLAKEKETLSIISGVSPFEPLEAGPGKRAP